MPIAAPETPAFDLKSTAWTLTALRLHSADVAAITAALDERFGDSPGLFEGEALVMDLSQLRDTAAELDMAALLRQLQRHQMQVIAAMGGSESQMAAAREAGLAWASGAEPRALPPAARPAAATAAAVTPAPTEEPPPVDDPAPAEAAAAASEAPPPAPSQAPTLVVDKPLRSGQRVYARGGDLVVLAAVSFGAEVIADGHIHVYAPLRGRAMAGARGNTAARIFSTCMQPQLVSIAGMYRTTETPLPDDVLGRAAQVRLDGERLIVEPLNP